MQSLPCIGKHSNARHSKSLTQSGSATAARAWLVAAALVSLATFTAHPQPAPIDARRVRIPMEPGMNANHPGPPGSSAPPPSGTHGTTAMGSATVEQRKFDVEYQTQTLNAYIYDYLRKQNLNQTATCLLNEGSFPANPVVIENRDGGLLEWWLSLFWDAYLQRLLQKPDGSAPTSASSGPAAPPGAEPKGRAPRVMLTAAPPSTAPPAGSMAATLTAAGSTHGMEAKQQMKADPGVSLMGNTLPPNAPPAAYAPGVYKAPAHASSRGASFSSSIATAPAGASATSPVSVPGQSGSLYLVPGWPTGYPSSAGYGPPPSSPDLSALAANSGSPATNMTPRSPQTQEAQAQAQAQAQEEDKKRGKSRRRSQNASVHLPPASPTAQLQAPPPQQLQAPSARSASSLGGYDSSAYPGAVAYRAAPSGMAMVGLPPGMGGMGGVPPGAMPKGYYPGYVPARATPSVMGSPHMTMPAKPQSAPGPPQLYFTSMPYPSPSRAPYSPNIANAPTPPPNSAPMGSMYAPQGRAYGVPTHVEGTRGVSVASPSMGSVASPNAHPIAPPAAAGAHPQWKTGDENGSAKRKAEDASAAAAVRARQSVMWPYSAYPGGVSVVGNPVGGVSHAYPSPGGNGNGNGNGNGAGNGAGGVAGVNAAFAPYASPHWDASTMTAIAGGGLSDEGAPQMPTHGATSQLYPALPQQQAQAQAQAQPQSQALTASNSSEFFSFFDDATDQGAHGGQLHGSAGGMMSGMGGLNASLPWGIGGSLGNGGIGGAGNGSGNGNGAAVDDSLTSAGASLGVDPDAFLTHGGTDDGQNQVTALAFSRDGQLLASGSQDKHLALYNTDTCQQMHKWAAHTAPVSDVRLTTDLSATALLASAGFDRCVKLWRVPDTHDHEAAVPQCVATLSGYETHVNSVDVTPAPHDRLVTADAEGNLKLWDLTAARATAVREHSAQRSARFAPASASVVAAGGVDLSAVVHDLASGSSQAAHVLQGHAKPVLSVTWLNNARLLTCSEECVRLWDLRQPREPYRVYNAASAKLSCVTPHPLASSVVLVGAYKAVHLWDWDAQRALVVPIHSDLVSALATSPTTGQAASASHDRSVRLYACRPL